MITTLESRLWAVMIVQVLTVRYMYAVSGQA